MGKLKVPEGYDLQNSTIGDCLKQIKRSNHQATRNVPATIEVWVCDILPQQTKAIVNFIEKFLKPLDNSDLSHIKRFKKTSADGQTFISAVLCSVYATNDKQYILGLLEEFDTEINNVNNLRKHQIPSELPHTKEIALDWSSQYWPLSWKGNPNHQQLVTATFNMEAEREIIALLIRKAKESERVVTIIAEKDIERDIMKILQVVYDKSHEHILRHSIMCGITGVAETELAARNEANGQSNQGYLCHNLMVYTTHEPCTMCAMALVHSRVGQLVYIWKHPLGAIESSHFIGDRNDLNWTFDIWRWVGPESVEEFKWATEVCP